MTYCIAYMTFSDKKSATAMASLLLEEKLIACANITEGGTSLYFWEGKVQEENEVYLLAKTRDDLRREVTDLVKARHAYDCPCIVFWPLSDGNPAFLEWISRETKAE